MHNPARDLPRVLNSTMLIAITAFTLMVAALYIVLPFSTVRDTDTPVVVCLPAPSPPIYVCPHR